ncbi:hypothetical protein SLEP1_g4828 [Rubroshorea leprosula]|uniref:Uncharacterized protein n=1 Tax=Rubroshorea leprosula TaxID=152421 RepID=A0AAV5HZG0_9ROSI|nr:hypothetical protein SLEP1_g4828 [Rubroshorea leprosula]
MKDGLPDLSSTPAWLRPWAVFSLDMTLESQEESPPWNLF